jgi:hypothetical protein
MKAYPILIDLDVSNDPDKIYEHTKNILASILAHIDLDLGYQRRIKLILIELITNSIKHSPEETTAIKLVIDHPHLSIQKIEKGLEIAFSSASAQFPFEDLDSILDISFSEANRHNIQPLGKYKFKFLKSEPGDQPDVLHIPEHFGLYIITLASDSFIYQYDPVLGENSYIIHLNL